MSTNRQNKVRDIMSTPVETISRDAKVSDAAAKMRDENISALIVTTSAGGGLQ
jgi:predicted transcriptional regulator